MCGARGETLAFDPLPSDDPAIAALRQAVSALSPEARSETLCIRTTRPVGSYTATIWATETLGPLPKAGENCLIVLVG
jgi:hypothetical protein